jgi:hypothetical protein
VDVPFVQHWASEDDDEKAITFRRHLDIRRLAKRPSDPGTLKI